MQSQFPNPIERAYNMWYKSQIKCGRKKIISTRTLLFSNRALYHCKTDQAIRVPGFVTDEVIYPAYKSYNVCPFSPDQTPMYCCRWYWYIQNGYHDELPTLSKPWQIRKYPDKYVIILINTQVSWQICKYTEKYVSIHRKYRQMVKISKLEPPIIKWQNSLSY